MKTKFKFLTIALLFLSVASFAKSTELANVSNSENSAFISVSNQLDYNYGVKIGEELTTKTDVTKFTENESLKNNNSSVLDYNCATAYGDSWTVTVCSNASPEDNAALACGLADYLDANYP
jgi:hypothetical protein